MTKTCTICKTEKSVDFFHRQKWGDGYWNWCKPCKAIRSKEWFSNNKEKEKMRAAEYYLDNAKLKRNYRKRYYEDHASEVSKYARAYYARNKQKINTRAAVRNKVRYHADPIYRLNRSMSNQMRLSLRGRKKQRQWEKLVDYSLEELKLHLEKSFTKEMNWDNYGSYWHIDHKIPLSWFKITSSRDVTFKSAWNLSNLQPMVASENLSKANRYANEGDQLLINIRYL